MIGSGAFGSVYRGMDDKTKKEVAIKVLDLVSIERDETSQKVKDIRRRLAKTESEIMMKVNSDHAMKCYDVY
jgi:serine/threonine protein kinase